MELPVEILGERRPTCCAGCRAVAESIRDAGLSDYYRFRTERPERAEGLVPEFLREARVYDDARIRERFSTVRGEDLRESTLLLEGIECAACLWLNERHLASVPGVEQAEVNYATHRARVLWHPSRTRLSAILEAVRRIGYTAHPYDPARAESLLEDERRRALRRLGLAGLLGMQVMMLAVALYAGDFYGMEDRFRALLRWASLALAAPIVAVCARSFYAGAWRDLRNRSPGMDVPVALGITIAFAGSVVATVGGRGEVYYDSVAMFVFLLLLARFLELAARRRAVGRAEALGGARPALATRLGEAGEETVPVGELVPGDRVLVRPGETVPADGRVAEGRSSVDESVLTGESRPLPRAAGDAVIGGSVNYESPLVVEVEQVGEQTVLSRILELVERARAERPRAALLADRIAAHFVAGVLLIAGAVGAWWWLHEPQAWLPVTVSLLVVTCPCALSLATPTAITAALSGLLARGVVVTRGAALERLAAADRCVLDKTGTLTEGRLRIARITTFGRLDEREVLRVAAALEQASEHPLARALREAVPDPPAATEPASVPGAGIGARVQGTAYRLGTLAHVRAGGAASPRALVEALDGEQRASAILADEEAILALLTFDDRPREGAREALAVLAALGVEVSVLSGDRPAAAAATAQALGIESVEGGLSPADKVARVRTLQGAGHVVAMAGDGVNDAPVLAVADVSAALGAGTDAARASADLILVGERLDGLGDAVATARATRGIIRQNLGWALGYNLLALPAAAAGLVPPWLAAVGMSASSLLVVANGLRAGRRPVPGPL